MNQITTDYLVVGGGAISVAFVDTLLSETSDTQIVIVDRHHRPGGHWNDAYPFVRLHAPSAFYGVNSRELGTWTKDTVGLNKGLYVQASATEIVDYFEQVVNRRFLPSGRVRWFSQCNYETDRGGGHRFTSLLTGDTWEVTVNKRLVDTTQTQTEVPSTHPPKYKVAPAVKVIPVNGLVDVRQPYSNYTLVGAGKTAIDACVWLLDNGVPPSRIRWIRPRDPWLQSRLSVQPGVENMQRTVGATLGQLTCIANATSIPDLFARLEQRELLFRIDPTVEPTVYRCATVSPAELALLRQVIDVVRLGRVQAIEPTQIVLDRGTLPARRDALYVDCSARAVIPPLSPAVFEGNRINVLGVRFCQPTFSAAMIAFVESHFETQDDKNHLCAVVPIPERPLDWLRMWGITLANTARWEKHAEIKAWLAGVRLNVATIGLRGVDTPDAATLASFQDLQRQVRDMAAAAMANIPSLLATVE